MYQQRTVKIRTKNPSSNPLRKSILVPFLAVARLGSRTATSAVFPGERRRIYECNSVESIENSRDKLRMKRCFSQGNVMQADMYHGTFDVNAIKRHFGISVTEGYGLVGKQIVGFQGNGMVLIQDDTQLQAFCRQHTPTNYYIERFHNYGREYRIHATQERAFLSWRKLRKSDAEQKWFFNSINCNWVGEDNELFQKPANWNELCQASVNAMRAVGLDIGCADVRVSATDPRQYIICEVNSAPALAEVGIEAYQAEIKRVLMNKYLKDAK
jgi:glutathione synthase/RimK-type ligase-like ATP-grasp enzyme